MNASRGGDLDALIWRVWTGTAGLIRNRLEAIDAAGAALLAGSFDDAQRTAAVTSAHKLSGSLGTFGLPEGSALAGELETLLRTPAPSPLRVCEIAGLLHTIVTNGPQAPEAGAAAGAAPAAAAPPRAPEPAPDAEVIDVLLIEDDDALSELLLRALENEGHTAAVISNGKVAVETLTGEAAPKCRLLLLDVDLPGLDGLAVLRQLAAAGVTERSPAIMLTVRASESEVVEALQSGAVDHVAKPFSMPVLMERVRLALER